MLGKRGWKVPGSVWGKGACLGRAEGGGSGFRAAQAWGLGACRGRERAGTLEGHRERAWGREVRMAAEPQLKG